MTRYWLDVKMAAMQSFQFDFFEVDVLANDRIIFLFEQFLFGGFAVFAGDIEIAGAGRRLELDEFAIAACHGDCPRRQMNAARWEIGEGRTES